MTDFTATYSSIPVYFFTAVVFAYCFIKVMQAYRRKPNKLAIYLILLFAGSCFVAIGSGIDGFFAIAGNPRLGYAISLGAVAIMHIGLLYFSTDTFSSGKIEKNLVWIRIAFSVTFTIACLLGSVALLGADTLPVPIPSLIPLGIMFMLSTAMDATLGIQALKLSGRVENPIFKMAIKNISYYAFGCLLIYVFFMLDGVDPALHGTTWFGFAGACMYMITGFLANYGFIKPIVARENTPQ